MRPAGLISAWVLLICVTRVFGADDPETEARDAHRAQLKQVAGSFKLADLGTQQSIALASEPVLLYTDATRATFESSLWIWGETGRPESLMAIEYYPNRANNSHWLYEIVSVSDRLITASNEMGLSWAAQEPGLTLQDFPGAGVPAEEAARRFRQMKQLLRRFTAHEAAVIEGRIELRPLANALHRYSDAEAQLIDGAVFAFANGTNPEVFVMLEAHAVPDGPHVWKYALARMTGGSLAVSIDDQEVWTCEAADPPSSRESYVNGWLTLE